jgi:hypothetical protein
MEEVEVEGLSLQSRPPRPPPRPYSLLYTRRPLLPAGSRKLKGEMDSMVRELSTNSPEPISSTTTTTRNWHRVRIHAIILEPLSEPQLLLLMFTPNPELPVMSVAGPSSSRKRTSEQLDPSTKNSIDAQRQPPEDEGQDQPRARKRVATGEIDAMDEQVDGNKDVDRDSGKAVDVTREEPEPGDMQRERASEPTTATTTTMGEIHSQEQRLPSKVPAISPVASSSNQRTSYETTKVAVEGAVRRGANRWT